MEKVIYVDVLLAVNYIVNWLLLKGAAKISGQPVKGYRVILGASVGAMSSLLIFVPKLGVLFWLFVKISVSLIMAAITYKFSSFFGLLKLWFIFLIVSIVFAGTMYAIYSNFGDLVLWYNGVVYFDISPVTLVICAAVAYAALWLFDFIFSKSKSRGGNYVIIVEFKGKKISLNAIEDTGNNLLEPFSGLPVVVCSLEAALSIIPETWIEWICKTVAGKNQMELIPTGCRLISYSAVGSKGLLPAFKPDSITIKRADGSNIHCNGYLALSDSMFHGHYKAVVNPQLVKISV